MGLDQRPLRSTFSPRHDMRYALPFVPPHAERPAVVWQGAMRPNRWMNALRCRSCDLLNASRATPAVRPAHK